MTQWSFHNPVRVHVAPLSTLPALLHGDGDLLLVVSRGFRTRGGVERIEQLVRGRRMYVVDDVPANPGLEDVEQRLAALSSAAIGEVLAIGGGSVMDAAKILATGLDGVSPRRHLFEGLPLPSRRRTRLLCVPTTAGSGSEVTPFATVWDHEAKKKYSIAGDAMYPDAALLDAELTLTLPEEVRVSTALDAMTQAFEATWSRRANPISTSFAVSALRISLHTIVTMEQRPDDLALRRAMLEASLLAGLAISHTRTALCHSISYPLTAHLGVPHGYACTFTLPEVFAFNRAADEPRFEQLASALGFASATAVQNRVAELLDVLSVGERLRHYVDDAGAVAALVPEMLTPGRADNNIREAALDDVQSIVASACRRMGLRP